MNIIFLFTGQARCSPFNIDYTKRNMDILDFYNKYIFTDKFKSLYKYKVYFSTDNIDVNEAINYFSMDNIGNIHLIDTDFYLKPIKNKINNVNYFLNKYNNKIFGKYNRHDGSIYQHHKILDCYNLFRDDIINNYNNDYSKCDFIIRLRLDYFIKYDIIDIITFFTIKPNLEIVLNWDFFALGKKKIMNYYCTGLENNYGNYTNQVVVPDILPIMKQYKNLELYRWMYAPERQLFEMLFEYCVINNIDINKSIYNFDIGTIRFKEFQIDWSNIHTS